jgi:hydroxymethylglutaryl-CoA lyase
MTALSAGIRTIDSPVGGLRGYPGNVATEDVLYALRDSPDSAPGDLDAWWRSAFVYRISCDNSSRVAKANRMRRERGVKL